MRTAFYVQKIWTCFRICPRLVMGKKMNNYENYQNGEEIEIDLFQLCKYVFKHTVIIIIVTVLGIGLGAGYAAWKNKDVVIVQNYTSSSTLYCDPVINEVDGTTDISAQTAMLNDYVVFATSRPVLEKVIAQLDMDVTVDEFASSVQAALIENSRVLKIQATSETPEKAQTIAQLIADITIKNIGEDPSFSTLHILESANLPSAPDEVPDEKTDKTNKTPAKTDVKKSALIGAVLGFFIICGIYACIYIFSDKIMNEDDVKRFLRLMTVAEVKKGDDLEKCISRIRTELDFDTIQLGQDQSLIDEFIAITELSRTGKAVVPVITEGSHARILRKSIEKLLAAECKIPGVILAEA